MRTNRISLGGLRALAAAVMLGAYRSIEDGTAYGATHAQIVRARQAVAWFRSQSRDHAFSYLNACDLLDLDPAAGLVAVEHLLVGDVFQMDTEEPTIQACTPLICQGCGRVLPNRRPAWTWGASFYCTGCRDSGECLPAGATWRKATRRERQAPEVLVSASSLHRRFEPLDLRPEEWIKAAPILAEMNARDNPFKHRDEGAGGRV